MVSVPATLCPRVHKSTSSMIRKGFRFVPLQRIVGMFVAESHLPVCTLNPRGSTDCGWEKEMRRRLTTFWLVPFLLSGNDFSNRMSLRWEQNWCSRWDWNSGKEHLLIVLVTSWELVAFKRMDLYLACTIWAKCALTLVSIWVVIYNQEIIYLILHTIPVNLSDLTALIDSLLLGPQRWTAYHT